ncbi:hypothetical protein ABBQ32_009230 [Trebouxia sp. C0010 RCD-2024]
MATKPTLVRVKRRRHDPAPEGLVLESSEGAQASESDPVNALAALALSAPAKKKRRFQLVTTLTDSHSPADNLLHDLASPGPDEASILANYHHLVQSYLRQQQHEGEEQHALQVLLQAQPEVDAPLQGQSDDDLAYDYYVAAQTETEADFTDLPTVQVKQHLVQTV